MDLKKAKDYYEIGAIRCFDIVRDPISSSWMLVIAGAEHRSWTLQTALKKDKLFATADSVITEIERITGRVSSLHVSI